MFFRQIQDEILAQYAYLVGCQRTGEALLIDPERDIDRYLALAESEGLRITAVTETHIHADFLSGTREVAEAVGARVYVSAEGGEGWSYEWVDDYDHVLLRDGDTFMVGNVQVRAIHTPGHTPEHLSFAITDLGGGADEPMGIATGDFVFVGDLGRPDLLESAAQLEGMREPSARTLYSSVQRFMEWPDYLQLWPGHGAGSACGKALGAVPETTVGYERRVSPALGAAREGEDAFVRYILEGQNEPPFYFGRMKRENRDGPAVLGELRTPREVDLVELGEIAGREDLVVIDIRGDRAAFMSQHLPGSLGIPLNRSFATAAGSLVPDPQLLIYLIAEPEEVETATRALVRIGLDRVEGFATPETLGRYFAEGGRSASIPRIDFAEMSRRATDPGVRVADVRYASEYDAGHAAGALHLPYTRLPELHDRVPTGETLLVHCAAGGRAAAAASYLARLGHEVAWVDDDFSRYVASGNLETGVPA